MQQSTALLVRASLSGHHWKKLFDSIGRIQSMIDQSELSSSVTELFETGVSFRLDSRHSQVGIDSGKDWGVISNEQLPDCVASDQHTEVMT